MHARHPPWFSLRSPLPRRLHLPSSRSKEATLDQTHHAYGLDRLDSGDTCRAAKVLLRVFPGRSDSTTAATIATAADCQRSFLHVHFCDQYPSFWPCAVFTPPTTPMPSIGGDTRRTTSLFNIRDIKQITADTIQSRCVSEFVAVAYKAVSTGRVGTFSWKPKRELQHFGVTRYWFGTPTQDHSQALKKLSAKSRTDASQRKL